MSDSAQRWSPRMILGQIPAQLRDAWRWIAIVSGIIAVLVAYVVHLHLNTHVIVQELFIDPVEFGVLPLHVGIYSYIGATTMVVGGAVMVFAGWAAPRAGRAIRQFLALFGGFVLWLGIDDVFMIHEYIGLRLAWLIGSDNVPKDRQWLEALVFGCYGLVWLSLVVFFLRSILKTNWILLLLVFVGFAISVLLDMKQFIPFLPTPSTRGAMTALEVAEDIAKMAGGFFALAYGLTTAKSAVSQNSLPNSLTT